MQPAANEIIEHIDNLASRTLAYFSAIAHLEEHNPDPWDHTPLEPDHYWSQLTASDRSLSSELQDELLDVVRKIANSFPHSGLTTPSDESDLVIWTKSARASLRLRMYNHWEMEILHDEGTYLGTQAAGQSENTPAHPDTARQQFSVSLAGLRRLADLLDIPPLLTTAEFRSNPQISTDFHTDTAFVMMNIDPDNAELEDRYGAIQECFLRFKISAVRVDDVEHSGVVTDEIKERIRLSEFLIADVTEERPSVYYEIGYAHALGKKVILYRLAGSKLHFDIAAYHCPEYKNLTQLKTMLMRRLGEMTNKKPQ